VKFYFYTNVSFEDWDYDTSVKGGIGGCETSIAEMSWRLAREGHEVVVYAPIKKTTKPKWRGTTWKHFKKATFKEPGVWILYRCPEMLDKFPKKHPKQTVWLLWQDWDYPTLTKERNTICDKQMTLCQAHAEYMVKVYPYVQKKLWITSNGIKLDIIEAAERSKQVRDPYRVMYASSPDRGLKSALQVIKKAREYEPRINFHAFYGFNNLDKLLKRAPETITGKRDNYSSLREDKEMILELLKQDNVFYHGRISQKQLMKEWFKSNVYLYITNFFETSHISGMEAQACGSVPLFSPIFAQAQNLRHGIAVEGLAQDPLTIARAAGELVKMVRLQDQLDAMRPAMMADARERFTWDVFVDQWIYEAEHNRKGFEANYEFPRQYEG